MPMTPAQIEASIRKKAVEGTGLSGNSKGVIDPANQAVYDKYRKDLDASIAAKAQAGTGLVGDKKKYVSAFNQTMYDKLVAEKAGSSGGTTTDQPPPAVDAQPDPAIQSSANTSFTPPAYTAMDYAAALNQAGQQLDPLYRRALENIKSGQWQNNLNAGEAAAATGGAHSGLAADLQNKVNIAAGNERADADAERNAKASELAQALVSRSEDRGDRLRSQAFQEYLGEGQLGLSRDQFNRGMFESDRGFNRGVLESDRGFDRGVLESDRSFDFQKATQEWNQQFQQGQFDFQKAQTIWERTFQEKNFQQQVKDEAARRGLQWASLEESRKGRIADDLFRQKAFDKDQDWKQKDYDWMTGPENPNNMPKITPPSTQEVEFDYVNRLDSLSDDQLRSFFTNERSSIVRDLDIGGYNRLYGMYFDQYGLPRSR